MHVSLSNQFLHNPFADPLFEPQPDPLLESLPGQVRRASSYVPPDYLFQELYPFYFSFNQSMQFVQVGPALRSLYPLLAFGESVQEHFRLQSCNNSLQFDDICQHPNLIYILESCYDGLKLQGQMVRIQSQGIIFFLGTPWIHDLNTLTALDARFSGHGLLNICPLASGSQSLLPHPDASNLSVLPLTVSSLSPDEVGQPIEVDSAESMGQSSLDYALSHAELTKALLEQATEAIEITNAEMEIVYVNAAFEAITGYQRADVLGKTPASLFRAGQHDQAFYDEIWQTISAGRVWQGSLISKRKDDSFYYQDATLFPILDPQGQIVNYVAIKRDVSDRKHTQTKLEHSLSLLQATFEATADGILVADVRGKITHFNRKFIDLWQIPETVVQSRDNQQVMRFIESQLKDPRNFSAKTLMNLYVRTFAESSDLLELRDGRVLERYTSSQQLEDTVIGWVWSFRDVTERQRTEAKIRYQALYDALTGLPNRTYFNERLATALTQATRNNNLLAVLFLDLDRFKLINDTLGHAAGDLLLQGVAERLLKCVREGDTVSRWAGDEFTLILPNIHTVENAVAIAERILESLREEFVLEGHTLHASSSIGIAFYPTDGGDAETILKNADAALYRSKEGGRNSYQLYTAAINSGSSELLTLENHLHRALQRQEFVIYYQPQVNVETGRITQMEALIRWHHPKLGIISPGKFIPVAEETGLIVSIGEWALQTACAQNQRWQELGLPPVSMAVNLSAHQFRQPNLVEKVQQILQQTGLSPEHLELEITETTMMKDVELTRVTLGELHQMGVSIALDDFGTGYSSLGYLKTFPLHTLKIDQSFIRDLTTDPNDEAIVTAIVAMGKVLNLKLVAEGVENEEQETKLRSLKCDEMQGFFFSPPMQAEDATNFLHAINLPNSSLWRIGNH
jgi:diguanylate cyclase (GGDEF)-like protein/PAS domain S-box-containing protein